MKLSAKERQLTTIAAKLAGFLVIKWADATASDNGPLASEILTKLHEVGVQVMVGNESGIVHFQVPGTMVKGAVIPPSYSPNQTKMEFPNGHTPKG